MKTITTLAASVLGMATANSTLGADTFGTTGNEFTIDFVNIGNAGNADDAGAGGGIYSSPYGGVPYTYRMGTYEISQDAITKATAGGLANVTAGAWSGSQPAADMTWYAAAAFVNWLNTSSGHQAAYQLDTGNTTLTLWSSGEAWQAGGENLFRHKDAYYFLPSEDEWYKAAYHKNDGVTANYWDYATGSNTIPTAVVSGTGAGTAVYNGKAAPADVNSAGGLSPYGTRGQNGNVREWAENETDGINDLSANIRMVRGGDWFQGESALRPSTRGNDDLPSNSSNLIGFRVASVPEPSSTVLMLTAVLLAFPRRCHGNRTACCK